MEGENIARARLRIARVAEESFHACGFIEKPQLGLALEKGRQLARIERGLLGDAGEQHAFFLGFDDTDRSAVQHQQIVAATFHERHFAQGDTGRGVGGVGTVVLHCPPGGGEQSVDSPPRELFCSRHQGKG